MWRIVMTGEVREWLHRLRRVDRDTLQQVSAALDLLASEGPTLGRPIMDRVKGSRLHHLKELRPVRPRPAKSASCSPSIPHSDAVLLVAGDKAGNWRRWYAEAIPLAEQRYELWIKESQS